MTSGVEASEHHASPVIPAPEVPRSRFESARLAPAAFALVEAGAFVYYLALSRREWFFADEWELLSARGVNVHDLLRAHYGHWIAVPIVIYRLLWWTVGLRSYLPYVGLAIVVHLTAAALLRVIMLRSGVRPWTATIAASVFVLFGAGAQNILWAFQIAFTGALVLGLVQLLLTDHDGPIDRRDWIGIGAGFLALLCSGVAVTMVVVVGVATLLRRGWRVAALQTVPLGVVYFAWWQRYSAGKYSFRGTAGQVLEWLVKGVGALFGDLAPVPRLGWLLGALIAACLVGGLAIAVRDLGVRVVRERGAMPVALLVGVPVFLLVTGIDRSGAGTSFARSSRYMHIVAALALPAIAVAVDALLRWRRVLGVLALAVLLVGVPANVVKAKDYLDGPLVRSQRAYRQMILSIPREQLAAKVPPTLRPDPGYAPTVTLRWLREGVAQGRLPKPHALGPVDERSNELRLSLMEVNGSTGYKCRRLGAPLDHTMARGDKIGIIGNVAVVLRAGTGGPSSAPVSFGSGLLNQSFVNTLVAVEGPLTLRIFPRGRDFVCLPERT